MVIHLKNDLNLLESLRLYGTEEQCAAAMEKARWPDGFRFPQCQGHEHGQIYSRKLNQARSEQGLRPFSHPHGRHDHAGHLAAADHMD